MRNIYVARLNTRNQWCVHVSSWINDLEKDGLLMKSKQILTCKNKKEAEKTASYLNDNNIELYQLGYQCDKCNRYKDYCRAKSCKYTRRDNFIFTTTLRRSSKNNKVILKPTTKEVIKGVDSDKHIPLYRNSRF